MKPTPVQISEYSKSSGATQVWKAWRDKMIEQGRDVKREYMNWPIPQRDIELDATIAYAVIDDFMAWLDYTKLIQQSDSPIEQIIARIEQLRHDLRAVCGSPAESAIADQLAVELANLWVQDELLHQGEKNDSLAN